MTADSFVLLLILAGIFQCFLIKLDADFCAKTDVLYHVKEESTHPFFMKYFYQK